jgi:hypothetical protein
MNMSFGCSVIGVAIAGDVTQTAARGDAKKADFAHTDFVACARCARRVFGIQVTPKVSDYFGVAAQTGLCVGVCVLVLMRRAPIIFWSNACVWN